MAASIGRTGTRADGLRRPITSIRPAATGPLRGPLLHAVASLPWSRRSCGAMSKPHPPLDLLCDGHHLGMRPTGVPVPALRAHAAVPLSQDVSRTADPRLPSARFRHGRGIGGPQDAECCGGRVARRDDPAFRIDRRRTGPAPPQKVRRQRVDLRCGGTLRRDRIPNGLGRRVGRRCRSVCGPRQPQRGQYVYARRSTVCGRQAAAGGGHPPPPPPPPQNKGRGGGWGAGGWGGLM